MKATLIFGGIFLLSSLAIAAPDKKVGTASETQSTTASPAMPGANPRGNSGTGAAGMSDAKKKTGRPTSEYDGETRESLPNAGVDSGRPRSPAE